MKNMKKTSCSISPGIFATQDKSKTFTKQNVHDMNSGNEQKNITRSLQLQQLKSNKNLCSNVLSL